MPFGCHHPHGGDDDQALVGDLGSDNATVEDKTKPPPQKKAKSSFTSSSSSSPRAEEPAGEAVAAPWTAAEDEKLRDRRYTKLVTDLVNPTTTNPSGDAESTPSDNGSAREQRSAVGNPTTTNPSGDAESTPSDNGDAESTPSDNGRARYSKSAYSPWSADEDEKLRDLFAKYDGTMNMWSQVANELPGRTGRQCRERWINQLDPAISKAPWSEDEDRIILTYFRDGNGSQWSKMSQLMVGRPDNAIKNHWNRGMKPKVEEYIHNKNIDGVNRIKGDGGVYLIGDDIEGCLRAARAKAAKKAAKKGAKRAAKNYYDDDEHPYRIILEHLDGRMEHLETKLSDEKYETVKMLRGLAKNIIDSPTLDDGCTLNSYAERTIKEFVVTHLVDLSEERYEEPITDNARSGKCITLGEYVVDKIVESLKCGLRDILRNYDYQGKVQADKVRRLLKQIDVALEVNGFKNTAKGGSGPAENRKRDPKYYPDKVYNRASVVKLNIEVSIEERAQLERIAIIYLVLTTGNCSNLQLVIEDIPFDGGVYIMFSKFESIADHFTAYGRQVRGIILPEGIKMVVDTPTGTIDSNNTETEAAAPTAAAAAAGGGVDDNSSTEEDTEETSDLVDNAEIVNNETTPVAPGGVVDESSADAEDDDCISFGNNFTGDGEDEDEGEGEDDEKPPTFFGGTPSSSTSPHELLSNSLPSDNTRVVTPTNVPDSLSRAMERKLDAESRLLEANAAKVEKETRDLQRKYAIENLCDRSKRRFLEAHIRTSPERVRAVHENNQLVSSLVSSLYTGTEVAPPKFSQDVNETLEQIKFPNED